MMDRNHLPQSFVDQVKRHLDITWTDADTDAGVIDMMIDAEQAMNHKLGAEIDYLSPGQERRLYLNYLLYAHNNALDQFDSAYRAEILQIRHKHEVASFVASKEEGTNEE